MNTIFKNLYEKQEKVTFSFGKNWKSFLKSLDEHQFKNAKSSLTNFLNLNTFQGKTFLDVGCGSGLFSYAAFQLGADKIVSFDVDSFSVECCRYLHKKAGSPSNWKIYEGSILNNNFVSQLETFDIVYSWGVLHHTGQMWDAIKNSAKLTKKDGLYYIAIYNKKGGLLNSNMWLKIKRLYNNSSKIEKGIWEMMFMASFCVVKLIKLQSPIMIIKIYKERRGMDWRTDVIDWLGGYPYEFATVEEIFKFIKSNFPQFDLINLEGHDDTKNNQFLFKNNKRFKLENNLDLN